MAGTEGVRVLLVDDEPVLLRAYQSALGKRGWKVETASNAREAAGRLSEPSFDVILSDIAMPDMDGLELLRMVRERDLDVPVILMTGAPGLESAMRAIEYGAFRYLVKPVDADVLHDAVGRAARMHKMARLKREAMDLIAGQPLDGDRSALESRFGNALERLWIAYQPIVSTKEQRVFGYEALLRSGEPSIPHPGAFLEAAERLGRLRDLGRVIRERVAQQAPSAPEDAVLFINLHSSDLNDELLYASEGAFTAIARRCVLEITERASLETVKSPIERTRTLRSLGFRVAVDDLGAGYAGLTTFAQLEPEIVKLDLGLVRGIDADSRRLRIVRSMINLCDELGILVVAEGVETPAERAALEGLGCDLLQGYLFGRPAPRFEAARL